MLILESQIRSIIKEELKIILESNLEQIKQQIQDYVLKLSETNPNINQESIKELESAIDNITYRMDPMNPNKIYNFSEIVYNKPFNRVTYKDYLDKMTSILNLSTPLTLDGVSFSYDLNEELPYFSEYDKKKQMYFIIFLQYLKQNPSIEPKTISDLKRKSDQIMIDVEKMQKEKQKKIINAHAAKWDKLAAPEDAPLGKYAFSPQRQYLKINPPYERNTSLEARLLKAILDHFEGDKLLSLKNAQLIKDVMSKGLYPDIFKAPKTNMVYRGMTVSEDFIKSYLDVDPQSIGYKPIEINKAIAVKQTKNAYSWTTKLQTAKGFSTVNSKQIDNPYSIVLEASVDKNKDILLDVKSLYDIEDLQKFKEEAEVISLGDVITSKIRIQKLKVDPNKKNTFSWVV